MSFLIVDGTVRNLLLVLNLAVMVGGTGCAISRPGIRPSAPVENPRGVVFAVDGAGGFQATSEALQQVLAEQKVPLNVTVVDWTHGYGRVLADEMDWNHLCNEGQRLACTIAAYRQSCPGREIYLVGHSAGSAVVLTAAEALHCGSVTRIILLAPSVSADYDLRPALRCAEEGVDVFYSSRDVGYLGLGVAIVGTADRRWSSPAAGRTGFRNQGNTAEDLVLYPKLRQHPWHPCVEWSGNEGGHYGSYQPSFLRAYVLPLLKPRSQGY